MTGGAIRFDALCAAAIAAHIPDFTVLGDIQTGLLPHSPRRGDRWWPSGQRQSPPYDRAHQESDSHSKNLRPHQVRTAARDQKTVLSDRRIDRAIREKPVASAPQIPPQQWTAKHPANRRSPDYRRVVPCISYSMIKVKQKFGYDDSLDVFASTAARNLGRAGDGSFRGWRDQCGGH